MKKLLWLTVLCVFARCACGNGISVILVNVGTNAISAQIQTNGNLSGSVPGGGILAGQTVTNTDGTPSTPFYVEWGPSGQNAQFIQAVGQSGGPGKIVTVGPFPLFAQGVPTNCTDTFTICNPGYGDGTYQLLHQGTNSGLVNVPGGGCITLTMANPNCVPGQWSYYLAPNDIDLEGPGYHSGNTVGGPGDNPIVPINSGTSTGGGVGPNDPSNNGGGGSGGPVTPYAGGQGETNNNTNGPINYGTNVLANPTNAANNGVIQAGADALYTATVQGDNSILHAIENADLHNQQVGQGVSNGIQQVVQAVATNTATNLWGWTNFFGMLTNTNALDTNDIFSKADGSSSAGQTSLQGVGDSVATIAPPAIPDAGDFTITIGSGPMMQTFDINPLSGSSLFPQVAGVTPWVRRLSEWGMTLWFVIWLVGEINSALREAFLAPQSVSGDALPVVAEVEGLVIGAIVAIALNILIAAAVTYLSEGLVSGYLAHPFDGSGTQAVQAGVAWLDAVFDIGLCLSLSAQRVSIPFYLSKLVYRAVIVVRMVS